MRVIRPLFCAGVIWSGLVSAAWSAGIFCWQPKSFDYQPATNRYVIVHPTPLERPPCDQPARPCTWPIERRSADPYPYGWFGARPKAQPSRTGSYYGDYRDYQWNRTP